MIATMDSRINVASSGPRIASMTLGSRVDEGVCVVVVSSEAVAFAIDHSKRAFERLSIVDVKVKHRIDRHPEIFSSLRFEDERIFQRFPLSPLRSYSFTKTEFMIHMPD